MYAPAYAGAAVAEAKAKAKASMAKYLASLVKREEEGWTVLAAEVPQAPDERFFSSADELEQTPLIPAKRKAEDTPRRGVPGAPEPAGGGRAHGGAPGEGREGAANAQVPPGCSPLEGGPPGYPGRRQVAEAPGADGEGQGAGVSSEEDEDPAAPPPGGSVFTKALKVLEASTSSAMTRWWATSLASMRPLPLGSADCRPRSFEGPQLKQGGLERVVEAFYIAKMKYEHEARLSTPGQQVGKRAGLGYGGLENRPLGKEPTSWICPCCTMPWVRKGATKCMGCGKKPWRWRARIGS